MPQRWVAVVTTGLAAGVFSGLLGVGGGIVMVPLLVVVIGFDQHRAHATSLAAIAPVAAAGAVAFGSYGNVDLGIAAPLAAGALIGAPLGARMMHRATEARLRGAFGVLMVVVGLQMVLR